MFPHNLSVRSLFKIWANTYSYTVHIHSFICTCRPTWAWPYARSLVENPEIVSQTTKAAKRAAVETMRCLINLMRWYIMLELHVNSRLTQIKILLQHTLT